MVCIRDGKIINREPNCLKTEGTMKCCIAGCDADASSGSFCRIHSPINTSDRDYAVGDFLNELDDLVSSFQHRRVISDAELNRALILYAEREV